MATTPTTEHRQLIATRPGPAGALGGITLAARVEGARGAPPGRIVRFPSFGLTYVYRGRGRYRDDRHDLALGPGTLVFVHPHHPHWYGVVDGTVWDTLMVVFDGPLFRLAAEAGVLDLEQPVRTLGPVDHWLHRIDRFRLRPVPRTPAARDRECCALLELFCEIAGERARSEFHEPDDWFVDSLAVLDADLGRSLRLPDVAALIGLPYETWRRRFTDRAGTAPGRYRLLRRLEAAQQLLTETALPTREVAASLGFSDEHHLARHFRAYTGLTPRQYRDRRASS
jgi:AraC-like DNA-binding protein